VTLPRDSLSLTVGDHTIRAFIFDGTEQSGEITLTYAVLQSRLPTISLISAPTQPLRFLSSGPTLPQRTFDFQVSTQDPENLRFTYRVGATEWPVEASFPGMVRVVIPPERFEGALNPGDTYSISFRVSDRVGPRETSVYYFVRRRPTAAIVSNLVVGFSAGDPTANVEVLLDITAKDVIGDLTLKCSFDAGEPRSLGTGPPGTFATVTLPPGDFTGHLSQGTVHTVAFVVEGEGDSSAPAILRYTVGLQEGTPPAIAVVGASPLVLPSAGTGPLSVALRVTGGSSIGRVVHFRAGGAGEWILAPGTAGEEVTVAIPRENLSGFVAPGGLYAIAFRVDDPAGFDSAEAAYRVNCRPWAGLLSPSVIPVAAGATGLPPIRLGIEDDDADDALSLRVSVDGGEWAGDSAVDRGTDLRVPLPASLFVGHFEAGTHTVVVCVTDGVELSRGEELTYTVGVTVTPLPPVPPGGGGGNNEGPGDDPGKQDGSGLGTGAVAGIVVGGIVAAVAIAAAVFFVCRRRGAKTGSSSGGAPPSV
jgi:hypothetical protein